MHLFFKTNPDMNQRRQRFVQAAIDKHEKTGDSALRLMLESMPLLSKGIGRCNPNTKNIIENTIKNNPELQFIYNEWTEEEKKQMSCYRGYALLVTLGSAISLSLILLPLVLAFMLTPALGLTVFATIPLLGISLNLTTLACEKMHDSSVNSESSAEERLYVSRLRQ